MVNDNSVHARVDSVIKQLTKCTESFTPLNWIQLRQTLFRFLKDKRVKVSLFLQEGIQLTNGKILLPLPLPENPNSIQPGCVRSLDDSVSCLASADQLELLEHNRSPKSPLGWPLAP
jgi:hypothetical protein